LDLAKSVFQVHGVDQSGETVIRRPLRRGRVPAFFETLPVCLIGMEACSTTSRPPTVEIEIKTTLSGSIV
jgi:transposase